VSLAKAGNGSDAEAVVSIRDTGIGISAEMLPLVFDLFAQADRTLAHSQGGLGIGLSLVRSLVELHGGRVVASSDGLGKGSEFTVYLPLAVS
jgi:signal transduction histidine kinase